jgi:hypothetical protein
MIEKVERILRLIKFKNDFVKIEKVEGDFKNSKNYFVLSRACQQLRLSNFSRRNNIKSSQLKIYCDDVLVLGKFLLSTAFSTVMSSAGEDRLTDKILKGFFSKPPSFTHEFPFLSSCFFLSLSLCLSLPLFLSLSQSAHVHLLARAREEQTTKVFLLSEKN